jgi:hypothetical protein
MNALAAGWKHSAIVVFFDSSWPLRLNMLFSAQQRFRLARIVNKSQRRAAQF